MRIDEMKHENLLRPLKEAFRCRSNGWVTTIPGMRYGEFNQSVALNQTLKYHVANANASTTMTR